MLTGGSDPAWPEENMTTSDYHKTAAGEFRNEEGMLGSTNLEHVRDAEVEHVLCGRIYHM